VNIVSYKYLKKKHFKEFIEKGIVRIGTIYWYRDCENQKIRDPLEGRTKYTIEPRKESLTLSKEQAQAITNDYRIRGNICISPETTFSDFLNVPNAFVFCTSLNYDSKLMKKFDCDSFYKIIDAQSFANKISKELNKKHQLLFTVLNKVNYVDSKDIKITNENKNSVIRTNPYDQSKSERMKTIYIEDYFSKPDAFRQEVEFRFIFVPKNPIEKKAVKINCKKLVEYCLFNDD
jgi:hypothetical protein